MRSTAQWPERRFDSRLLRLGTVQLLPPVEWRVLIGGGGNGGARINELVEFIEYELNENDKTSFSHISNSP